ncbi:MAG: hypothetical protein KA370_02055 [Paludibacter sp.]|nr:hypothetical protein [Paludibacter sp.]
MEENTRLLTSQNCAPKVVKIYNYSIFIAVPVLIPTSQGSNLSRTPTLGYSELKLNQLLFL